MGVVNQFAKRQASKRRGQAQMGEYDWDKYEQAEQPEEYPLPTGQTISKEDFEEETVDPWEIYYTYMETVAIPQIDETQQVLRNLNKSIPGEMLPEPGDPVDLPKLYEETDQSLGTIKNFLSDKLPSSGREIGNFLDENTMRSIKERDEEVLQTLEEQGFPEGYEQMKEEYLPEQRPQRSEITSEEIDKIFDEIAEETIRTTPPSEQDEPIDPTEYDTRRLGSTVAQLFANRG